MVIYYGSNIIKALIKEFGMKNYQYLILNTGFRLFDDRFLLLP